MVSKQETGAIILRVVLGIIFFIHGLHKFQAGGWYVEFFESVGLPGFLVYVVGTIELVGGILLIIGLATTVVSVIFAIIMIGAMFSAKFSMGFLEGYELDLALLAMSIYLALAGKTAASLDNVLFKSKKG